jgi:hypothetical protein
VLPAIGDEAYLDILRLWISDCDECHEKCPPPANGPLPTRLIYLGSKDDPIIRIYTPQPNDSLKYIALSHPWGPEPHFCTYQSNIEEYKKSISYQKLPATFQHTINITRQLGIQYLWIDSICIIQGEDGDFDQEAKKMEEVYSSAYCVLAASYAKSQCDGFIKPRTEDREFLTLGRRDKVAVYLCQFIDDFGAHVLESPLNKRGWVLQERALARRTIYFTDKQTYWECGGGVRCETLTKMDK